MNKLFLRQIITFNQFCTLIKQLLICIYIVQIYLANFPGYWNHSFVHSRAMNIPTPTSFLALGRATGGAHTAVAPADLASTVIFTREGRKHVAVEYLKKIYRWCLTSLLSR